MIAAPSRLAPPGAELLLAEPTWAEPTWAEPTWPEPTWPEPTRLARTRAEPILAEPNRAKATLAEPPRVRLPQAEPTWAEPTRSGFPRAEWVAGAAGPPDEKYDADIVILALDRVEETLAAIHSALTQTGVSAHLFVLDQGSPTDTLHRFAADLAGRRRATLLAVPQNLGVAGGRNLISALGHGRVIVALDNDAEFADTETVARMVAALDAEPRLAALGCRIVTHATGKDDLSSWGYPSSLLPCAGESFDAVTFVGAGHAIRRTAWNDAGGYDARLFFCWEEFDFCLRAIARGWRVRYRGDIVIRHKVSGERRVGWSGDRWFYYVRNRLYIERKLGQTWTTMLPRVVGYLIRSARHGLVLRTVRAIQAAARLGPAPDMPRIPIAALSYLERNDRQHRGSLLTRFRREVLARIGGAASAAAE
jgi:GT2 family glycosyltransferase